MGRPINKRYIGDAAGSIKVSHTFDSFNGAETAGGEDTYIVRQRSSNKFLVADTSDGWSEVLTLVDKDAGTLSAGEFRIDAQDAEGGAYNVVRLYNRTLRLGQASGSYVKEPWNISAAADIAISNVTLVGNDPVDITVADTSTLTTGDVITITDVVGTVELNGNSYTITVVDGTSITLDGTDSANFTAYTSGGTISGVGDTGSIDVQAS